MKFRAAYQAIELYEPGRLPVAVDLSDNTNLFGVAPSARRLLAALADALVTRYPTVFARTLKQVLADKHGVAPENITTGCGSDDLIDATVRAFWGPGDRVAFSWPTFGVVGAFARMNATQPVPVTMRPDCSVAAAELVAAAGGVTYVCSPNNPTGNVVSGLTITALDRDLPGLLLLDEAYADYDDVEYGAFAAQSQRTVSLRTMSKLYGLAGLRVGYAIGPAALIHEIEKSRGPYKVNAVGEALAARAVAEDGAWTREVVRLTRLYRQQLADALIAMGLKPLPSAANFVLAPLPAGFDAAGTNAALREHGVAARPFRALPHVGEALRITVGPWHLMERFLAAMTSILSTR